MIRRADILTENFRPGAMDRLGFSYAELSKDNPRLIYASSSGFGQTGPLKTFPAYDTIVQAMSGLMSVTGYPDGPPTRVGTSVSDLVAGTFMFCGIAAALYAREKTGKGARIDIAMRRHTQLSRAWADELRRNRQRRTADRQQTSIHDAL